MLHFDVPAGITGDASAARAPGALSTAHPAVLHICVTCAATLRLNRRCRSRIPALTATHPAMVHLGVAGAAPLRLQGGLGNCGGR